MPHSPQRDLHFTRLYYAAFFGGSAFISPFLNLFFIHQGLDGAQIGWTLSIAATVTLLAAPFWANRNTRWRSPRGALQIFLILTALSLLWLSQQTLFWGIALVSGLRALVSAGISPLSDSLALSITRATKAGYGSIRVWGSFGWIIFVLLSGWLVDRFGLSISLVGAFAITAVAALVLFSIQPQNFYHKPLTDETAPDFKAVVRRVLANRAMLGVAAMIVLINIGNSGITQFENVFLRDLGARDAIIGIAGMLSAVVELPCMLWADRLCTRRGSYNVLLTAMFLYVGLRLSVLAFPSVIAIMVTRALAGFAFSFYTIGAVRFISEQTTPHETRTVLALYNITLVNLVSIVISPLSGAAYDAFGGRLLYLIAATGYALAWGALRLGRTPNAVEIPDSRPAEV